MQYNVRAIEPASISPHESRNPTCRQPAQLVTHVAPWCAIIATCFCPSQVCQLWHRPRRNPALSTMYQTVRCLLELHGCQVARDLLAAHELDLPGLGAHVGFRDDVGLVPSLDLFILRPAKVQTSSMRVLSCGCNRSLTLLNRCIGGGSMVDSAS